MNKVQVIKRAREIICKINSKSIYPRSADEVVHAVLHYGCTWNEIGIDAKIFEARAKTYLTACGFDAWVIQDFQHQIKLSLRAEKDRRYSVDNEIALVA